MEKIKSCYFISIFMVLLTSESQASLMCTNQFSILPMRLESFVKSSPTDQAVSSPHCHFSPENSTLDTHREYYFTRSKDTYLTKNASYHSVYEDLNIFILDFRMINSDVVYLDFLNYEKIQDSKKGKDINISRFQKHKIFTDFFFINQNDSEQATSNRTNANLVINLVSRQFITFWLMNVPRESKTDHFQKMTIILSGKAQLKYLSEKEDTSFISVLHAPTYEDSKQPCHHSNQNQQKKWLTYLKENFYSNGESRFKKGVPNVIYKEHLHVFYHIYHVKMDLDLIYRKHLNPIQPSEKTENSNNLAVQYLRKDKSLYNLDICLISGETSLWKHCRYEPIRLLSNGKDNVHIVEIEQRGTARQQLRFLVGDCDKDKEYHVILYLNSQTKLERIIFEHSSCQLKLLVIF